MKILCKKYDILTRPLRMLYITVAQRFFIPESNEPGDRIGTDSWRQELFR